LFEPVVHIGMVGISKGPAETTTKEAATSEERNYRKDI
jgi:hypothetical protein